MFNKRIVIVIKNYLPKSPESLKGPASCAESFHYRDNREKTSELKKGNIYRSNPQVQTTVGVTSTNSSIKNGTSEPAPPPSNGLATSTFAKPPAARVPRPSPIQAGESTMP